MRPILFSEKGWRNHCAAKMTGDSELNANSLRQPEPAQQTSERQMDASSNDLNSAPKSKRGARLNVVNNRPSASRTGRATAIQNLAPEEWRPRNACSMTMDKALREMKFPSRLAGAEWVLE